MKRDGWKSKRLRKAEVFSGPASQRFAGLGHPIGANGCLITVKALYNLHRIQGRYVLVVSLCIGGGQGIAAIFERPQN